MIGLTAELFSIAQGFLAVLAMAIVAFALFAAFACAATVLNHFRKPAPAQPREPAKLRLVKPEPETAAEPDREDDEWVKDFG